MYRLCQSERYFLLLSIAILLFYLSSATVYTQTDSLHPIPPPAKKQKRSLYVGGFVAPVVGITATDFFRIYNQTFGGKENSFNSALSAGFITKTRFSTGLWIGGTVETYRSDLQETYNQPFRTPGTDSTIYSRTITQDFRVRAIPILFTLDVSPVEAQFRSYGGIGIGLAYIDMYWAENINSNFANDLRQGGIHYNKFKFVPAFRIYLGTQLGFDREEATSFLHSLFFEVRYTYIPFSVPIFQQTAEQFAPVSPTLYNSYLIQTGGISLTMGILLQFFSK